MAQRRVEAVERALTLLGAFSRDRRELTLTELANASGFYKSTILRLMASLEYFGYVVRDERGVYRIGPAVLRLAPLAVEGPQLEDLVRPVLVALREASEETAAFHVRDGEARICRLCENGRLQLRHHLDEGARVALGEEEAVDQALGGELPPGRVARSHGGRQAGLSTVAIAIHDDAGELRGALSLSGPSARFDARIEAHHAPLLIEAAARLTHAWPRMLGPI
ncbi:helix-turn-helix domain-containing protein [Salinicola sp. RZ23]|uniref:IclR family transcriptional regulator n=1 Tax=Salinicola sp. RZ23 TaxID=1949087 RepID=UPI000DA1D59C|nr:helix-turn-helix domain-containing protein [Salinicola sp. RZ23]